MLLADSNIKKSIISKAGELGFVKTGFAKAELLDKESGLLYEWLNKGFDADMKWIERSFDKRKDVKLIMPGAKTVISLAYNYYTDIRHDQDQPKISRYAWGTDYHKVIKEKLKELCRFIKTTFYCEDAGNAADESISPEKHGIASPLKSGLARLPARPSDGRNGQAITKAYVDDGPVMDKSWAVHAGVGWLGKHTNLINPEYGSWIFLSEIITNLEFETYDDPIDDLCGSCRICIDACPTGAIVDEYVLDANLCISYQTIENRGEIPEHIDLHGWIFGCDVCQDVCPFNKNDKPTTDKNFYPKDALRTPLSPLPHQVRDKPLQMEGNVGFKTKAELEAITEEEFNVTFADSPIKRTKFKGWRRNLERCSPRHPKS